MEQQVVVLVLKSQLYQGFYSHIFVEPKPSGKYRLIINLRNLNRFLEYKRLSMETIYSVRKNLVKDVFMTTLDLGDAYLHVTIFPEHKAFLRFAGVTQEGVFHWQFEALPFGLAASPRIFTNIQAEAVTHLHLQGMAVIPYLDDLLISGPSAAYVETDTQKVISVLRRLGWMVNLEKSSLEPAQVQTYLGFRVDSLAQKLFLPREKVEKVVRAIKRLIGAPVCSRREIVRVLGLMSASIPAVVWAQLHSRDLKSFHLSSWDKNNESLEESLIITRQVRSSLVWWSVPGNLEKGRPWGQWDPLKVTTDASARGWGAHLGKAKAQGSWQKEVARSSSNLRELRAVGEGLKAFKKTVTGKEVMVC